MASGATMTWEDIHVLDRVRPAYRPVQEMSAERKARILLLADMDFDYPGYHAVLVHEEGGRTYLRGRCPSFGLDVPRGHTITERECEELRGRTVVQAVFSDGMAAYVLTDDGLLFSCGDPINAQLGRRGTSMSDKKFGRVAIDGPVLAVAAGLSHVLAMTATKVFAFGRNDFCQAGVIGMVVVPEPREIYSGEGPKAPKQVACGFWHSAILTVGGQVLTCGRGEYTGHGHDNDVPRMTPVPKLQHVAVQQVGCTEGGTYALADGMLYGWGYNGGGRLCGASQDNNIPEPMVVDCGGHRISSIRYSNSMVLALTDPGEALHWGHCSDGTVISRPRRVEGCRLPREMFATGYLPDSGGTVYLDTTENQSRAFPAVTCHYNLVAELKEAKTKIAELQNAVEDANTREAAAQEACDQAKSKLLEAEVRISSLETASKDVKRQETVAREACDHTQSKLLEAEARISSLETSSEDARRRELVAREDCKSAQSRLLEAEARISVAELASEESKRRETAADQTRCLMGQEIKELQAQIARQQRELDSLAGQTGLRETVTRDDIQDIRGFIESRLGASESSIKTVIRDVCGALESRLGDLKPGTRGDQGAMAAQVSNMEREISALQMEKRELKINYRELTLDYRELNAEYQKLINETSDTTTSVKRVGTTLQQERVTEGTSFSQGHHTRYPRETPDVAHGARGRRSGKIRPQYGRGQQRPKDPDGKDK